MLSLDLGLLSTGGANVTGPDAPTATAISNDVTFGSLLPNIQLGIGWGILKSSEIHVFKKWFFFRKTIFLSLFF